MRPFLALLALASVSTGAMAQSEPMTPSMTCTQAAGLVNARGAVVLYTGPAIYDRYVRDASFCGVGQSPQPAWVRTSDVAQCPVGNICRSTPIEPAE